jgi:hypothetical protein
MTFHIYARHMEANMNHLLSCQECGRTTAHINVIPIYGARCERRLVQYPDDPPAFRDSGSETGRVLSFQDRYKPEPPPAA